MAQGYRVCLKNREGVGCARVRIAREYPVKRKRRRGRARRVREGEPGTGGHEGDGRRRKKEFANSTGGCPENTLNVWRNFGSFFFSIFVVADPFAVPRAFVSSPILILRGPHGVPGTRVGNEPGPERRGQGDGDELGGRGFTRALLHSLVIK